MNKKDIILCLIILIISGLLYGIYQLQDNDNNKKAIVYYENNKVLEIDLNDNNYREYIVNGYNGEVKIETIDGKIKVSDEISPKHLCSRQGYISKSYETIICLPNKIVIEIEDSINIDAIAR